MTLVVRELVVVVIAVVVCGRRWRSSRCSESLVCSKRAISLLQLLCRATTATILYHAVQPDNIAGRTHAAVDSKTAGGSQSMVDT